MTHSSHSTKHDSKKDDKWWDQATPHYYPSTYLKFVEERGFDAKALLQKANLPEDLLNRPERTITFAELQNIVVGVVEMVGLEGLGFEIGWRLPPTAFGSLGYALLCSANLNQALQLINRFWHLIAPGVFLNISEKDQVVEIEITTHSATPEVFKPITIESSLTSFFRGIQLMHPEAANHTEIWFTYPAPKHAPKLIEKLGNVQFSMPQNKIALPMSFMSTPLVMSNPTGLQFAIEQCEKEEALYGLAPNGLKPRVEQELTPSAEGYPRFDEICQKLHMTERTLRRKLQQEGCNYQSLLEDARRRDSIKLLDRRELEIQHIAELLGYADPANFTRAFRKWTGQTPTQYRLTRKN